MSALNCALSVSACMPTEVCACIHMAQRNWARNEYTLASLVCVPADSVLL